MTRADDFAAFCQKMLGSDPETPLVAPGADGLVNGAFLSALIDAFKVCCLSEGAAPNGKQPRPDPLDGYRPPAQ